MKRRAVHNIKNKVRADSVIRDQQQETAHIIVWPRVLGVAHKTQDARSHTTRHIQRTGLRTGSMHGEQALQAVWTVPSISFVLP